MKLVQRRPDSSRPKGEWEQIKASRDEEEDVNGYYIKTGFEVENLKNFKYAGQDHSLLYKKVLSPIAEYLVEKFM